MARKNGIKVGIVGGSGYTGVELLRLLALHPHCELAAITSRTEAGTAVADMFPNLRGHVKLKFSEPAKAGLDGCDLVFFANTYEPGISHVGIYIGNGDVVQAMAPGIGVAVGNIHEDYWAQHYYGALRPLG